MFKNFYDKCVFNNKELEKKRTYLYQYTNNYFKVVSMKVSTKPKGFEEINKKSDFVKHAEKHEVDRISLSRTKRNIREICLSNEFEYFATLTVSSQRADRYALEDCQKLLKKRLRYCQDLARKDGKKFMYIFITERHTDGAFHFHGLINFIPKQYTNEYGYISSQVFDEMGFNSFSKINSFNKVASYITKYVSKDCVKNMHNQIYISSRGLKKAERFEINDVPLFYDYENDYCKVKEFYFDDLNMKEKLDIIRRL